MQDELVSRRTQKDVVQLIADALGLPEGGLTCDSVAQDYSEWDSMGVLALMVMLKREGITLDIGEAAKLQSVSSIVDLFRAKGILRQWSQSVAT